MGDECLVCRQVAGEIELPGGFVCADANAAAFHLPPTDENSRPYLGHCLVVTRRHVDHLADLTIAETESIARVSRLIATALRAEGAERVHLAIIGLGADHFHQHLFPRYPGVPPGTSWMAVDDLPDAPRGGATEIAALVERLRAHL